MLGTQSSYDSEIEKRCTIIDLIDPLKVNQKYSLSSFEDLNKELEKKTNDVNEITHESYQMIYNMPVTGIGKSDELAILKYRLARRETEIDSMEQLLRNKEEELIIRELELGKKEKRTTMLKSPGIEKTGNSSGSPSSYQSYVFSKMNYNANMSEETALNEAIKQSEKLSSDIIDIPFRQPIAEVKSIPREYKDKPIDVTEDLLEEIYNLLLERKFNEVKSLLASDRITSKSTSWIRNLSYNGETLKQMLISKPEYIHKCIIMDE